MRKVVSLILALVMCMSLCVPAFAEDLKTKGEDGSEATYVLSEDPIQECEVTIPSLLGGENTYRGIIVPDGTVVTPKNGDHFLAGFRRADRTALIEPTKSVTIEVTEEDIASGTELVIYELQQATGVKDDVYITGIIGETICFIPESILNSEPGDTWEDTAETPDEPDSAEEVPEEVPEETSAETPDETETAPVFTDVPDWCAKEVVWAVEKNITKGTSDTTFGPKDTCNTAQILTFLHRAKGEPAATISNPFSDVSNPEAYYYKAALWASENGLVSGDTFGEKTACTRAAVVTCLWKLAGSPETAYAGNFTDVAADAAYAQAVAWAVEQEITKGTSDTTFGPDDTCTRGQIVTFLYRAYAG